jgi:6,7-dimethyl-8-ribityllumazine synthase
LAREGADVAIVARNEADLEATARELAAEMPVISAVLTPQNFHEHDEHRKFFHDHFVVKGAEAATACAATVDKVRHLLSPS